jgi:acylphosphatase
VTFPAEAEGRIRRRVLYSGRVQGVFFRATCLELARGLPVVGFVRNLPDGDVELEAEGPREAVERFLAAVAEHYRENIRRAEVSDLPPGRSESEFRVRY